MALAAAAPYLSAPAGALNGSFSKTSTTGSCQVQRKPGSSKIRLAGESRQAEIASCIY
jgi:hypothetical protein